jgi:hypothetical protein
MSSDFYAMVWALFVSAGFGAFMYLCLSAIHPPCAFSLSVLLAGQCFVVHRPPPLAIVAALVLCAAVAFGSLP